MLGVVLGELPVREDLSRAAIDDLVCALVSVHLYRALVLTAGWSRRRYERELGRQIRHAVLRFEVSPTTAPPP